jgi:hypothetical protein
MWVLLTLVAPWSWSPALKIILYVGMPSSAIAAANKLDS